MALTPKEIEELAVAAAIRAAKSEVEEAAERAAEAAARKVTLTPDEVSHMVAEAVRQTLIQMGIDTSNPIAMQRDFQHLRQWRESGEDLKRKGTVALLGIFLSGLVTLFLLGLRGWFQK